jgi:hypothetical protein
VAGRFDPSSRRPNRLNYCAGLGYSPQSVSGPGGGDLEESSTRAADENEMGSHGLIPDGVASCSCPLAAKAASAVVPPHRGEPMTHHDLLARSPSARSHVAAPPRHASRSGATAASTMKTPAAQRQYIISLPPITQHAHPSPSRKPQLAISSHYYVQSYTATKHSREAPLRLRRPARSPQWRRSSSPGSRPPPRARRREAKARR